MAKRSEITFDGKCFSARDGAVLLDEALGSGVTIPSNCRAGYCGTCRVRLVQGTVHGGGGGEAGIVHACQARVVGDAVIETARVVDVRTVQGVLSSLRCLSADVIEVGVRTDRALPHHAGQFVQVRFDGYPSRPFSMTHPLQGRQERGSVYFHIRRMKGGRVTSHLGRRIKRGHRVELTGPYGSAHFKSAGDGRLILVATNTGFAPIWAIAVAALRENPERPIIVIAGGGSVDALYMAPAMVQLARFPNVVVVPVCSSREIIAPAVRTGRPTDFLPQLLATDEVYACGAPPMVEAVRSIAVRAGAACHADPFVPNSDDPAGDGVLARALKWLTPPTQTKTSQGLQRARGGRGRRPSSAPATASASGSSRSDAGRHPLY